MYKVYKEGNREEEERKKRVDLKAKRKTRLEKLRYVAAFLVTEFRQQRNLQQTHSTNIKKKLAINLFS